MKCVVITTINPPSQAVAAWGRLPGWRLVVMGDRKTPAGWSCEGAKFLSLEDQRAEFGELADAIPENAYARKALGYAWAIKRGATAIFETDDDNAPYPDAARVLDERAADEDRSRGERLRSASGWINIYRHFGAGDSWPRGFPLQRIRDVRSTTGAPSAGTSPWAVMQFLTDVDPDVDAIYRMTSGSPIHFARERTFILDEGTRCPVNSQGTLWTPEAYPLMLLPLGVPCRVTDILRGYVATECLWRAGRAVAFSSPVARQQRNAHDLLEDFHDEALLYTSAEAWANLLAELPGSSASERYRAAVRLLSERHPRIAATARAYDLFLRYSGLE